MIKKLPVLLLIFVLPIFGQKKQQFITRQGQVTFFSYTNVENIEATNNQVLSIIDLQKKEIAVSMLMRAFVFKKDLMYEHFNESYIESDLYPKATFIGKFLNFDKNALPQTLLIEGDLTIHGITKKQTLKAAIEKTAKGFLIFGNFDVLVSDYQIKIPVILSSNIAKIIQIKYRFQYDNYEE